MKTPNCLLFYIRHYLYLIFLDLSNSIPYYRIYFSTKFVELKGKCKILEIKVHKNPTCESNI